MSTVLIVDDDPEMLIAVQEALAGDSYSILTAADGQSALDAANDNELDMVILDIDLARSISASGERLDGVQVLQRLRKNSDVGVLMLTTTGLTSMKILALEMGADDYLTKPFEPGEIAARVKSVLRRKGHDNGNTDVLTFGNLILDVGARKVFLAEQEIELTPIEFDLLLTLARRPGQAFSREQLVERVWKDAHAEDERLIDTHVSRLRKKVEEDPTKPLLVVTVRGIGYRLEQRND